MKKLFLLIFGILFSYSYLQAQCTAEGGMIATSDPTTICADGNSPDPINVSLTGNSGTNSGWVITDPDLNILGLPPAPPFDLDGAGAGTCLIWHISYEDDLMGADVGNNVANLTGCYHLSNEITVTRYNAMTDGGIITTSDPTEICAGDGQPDPINVALTGNVGTNSGWVITDPSGNILGLPPGPPFDLEGAGTGVCYIWHISYEDGLLGAEVGANAADLQGCYDLSDPIIVTRTGVNGGTIATSDPTEICAGDGQGDPINVDLTGNEGANSAWVITDAGLNILGLPPGPPFDLDGAGTGICLIWHISFEDGLMGAEVGANAADLMGCYSLSNAIAVTRFGVNGGEISTSDPTTICADGNSPDPINVELSGEEGANSAWVITDADGNILGLPAAPPFDLDGAGAGTCLIWHISFQDGLEGVEVGANAADLVGCYDLSNPITVNRYNAMTDGGIITTSDPTEICAGDGQGDPINVALTGNVGTNSGWVITDPDLNILGLPPGPPFDLDGAGTGVCYIWHISYEDGLVGAEVGANAADLQGCYDLSDPIIVTRTGVDGGEIVAASGNIYNRAVIANRASGTISVINTDNNQVESTHAMPDDGQPMYVVYNDLNNTVLVGDYNGKVAAFDGKTFMHMGSADAGDGVFHMWLSPDNQQLWVNNELDKTISVIDPNTLTNITTFSIPADLLDLGYKPHDVIVMPNNAAAFVTMLGPENQDYVVKYSTTTFMETARATVGTDPHVSLTSANDKLYVASQGSGEVKVLNRSDLSEVATIDVPNAHGLGMNNAGTYLYVGNISDGGTAANHTIDLATNTLVGMPVDAPFSAPHNYAVTGDDAKLFVTHSGAANDKVSIYSLAPTPTLMTSVTVGNNPFGLVTYTYVETFTETSICAGDGSSDVFDVSLENAEGANSAWVITDSDGNILALPLGPPFDLEGAGAGTCLIWHVSYEGTLEGAVVGANTADLMGCFDLSNPITVNRYTGDTEGGEISTTDPTEICAGDGQGDPINVTLTGNIGTNSAWVITDSNGNILGLPPGPPFDLDGAGSGTCLIWHLSFEDGLVGAQVGLNAADLQGCYDLSNPITVVRSGVNGGELTTADGMTELTICAGDGNSDAFDINLTDTEGTNSAWVITDPNGNILGLPPGPPFDLEGAGAGVCYVWHISYEDGLEGVEVGANTNDLMGCFDLSNPVIVTRNGVNGGELTTADGMTELTICAGDGISDAFDVNLTDTEGTNSGWVITDADGNILGLPPGPPFDLEGAGAGVCYVWHISFEDGLEGAEVGANANDLMGCFSLSNPVIVTRLTGPDCTGGCTAEGGELATADGMTELSICAGDGNSDAFDISLNGNQGTNSGWVITDADGNILGLPPGPPFDLEGAGSGVCYVWHISFEDGLEGAEVGANANDLMGCFDLSNPIIVTRNGVNGGDLTTADGMTELTICAGDGNSDAFDINLSDTEGSNSGWVITDADGNILGLPPGPPFDLEGAGSGVCYVWHISFEDGLEGAEVGANANDLEGCFDLSNPIIVTRNGVDGGELMTSNGLTELTICAGDGIPDPFDVNLTDTEGSNSAWVITDADGNILGLPPGPPFDLDGAGAGVCYVWHISFEDGLEGVEVGANAGDLTGCFDLSNPIIVTRLTGGDCNPSEGVDVELDITVDNLLYDQYEHVVYTITVANVGSETATGVTVHAGLPDGMVYSDHDTDKGDYSLYFETWDVGSLEPGEEATLELDLFTLVEEVNITNFVQVLTTDQSDVDSTPGNDTDQTPDEDDEAAVTIMPASGGGTGGGDGSADLSLDLSVEDNTYEQYEHNLFTFTVTNDGPDVATGIVVEITEPDGFKYTGDDASHGEYNDWFEEWTIPSLEVGETAVLEVEFYAVTDDPTVDYFAQIFIANESDPDSTPGNDTDQVADEDDETAITLTLINDFAGGAATNSAINTSATGVVLDKLYPNPATFEVNLSIESLEDLETTIQIYNLQGSMVIQESHTLLKGNNLFTFDVSNLPEGAYFIKVPNSNGTLDYKRFIKIN